MPKNGDIGTGARAPDESRSPRSQMPLKVGDAERARAMTFCVLVYSELLRALAARNQRLALFQLGPGTNPYLLLAIAVSGMLQLVIAGFPFTPHFFDVLPHTPFEWTAIVALALNPVTFIELGKVMWASIQRVKSPPRETDALLLEA